MLTPSWSSGRAKVSAVGSPPMYVSRSPDPRVGAGHLFDVAHAVLEADERGVAFGDGCDRLGAKDCVCPAVDDDAQVGRLADPADVLDQPSLARFCEVGRHQQQPVRAGVGCGLGLSDRVHRPAGRGSEDGHGAGDLVDRSTQDTVGLLEGEREPLAGAARREQPGHGVLRQPFEMLAIATLVELEIVAEVRDRKREQPALQLGGQVDRAVLGHEAVLRRRRGGCHHATDGERCLSKPKVVSGDAQRACIGGQEIRCRLGPVPVTDRSRPGR